MGEDGPGQGHLCHTDTFLFFIFLFFFLDCEECNKEYDGDCPLHGELLWIKDSEVW